MDKLSRSYRRRLETDQELRDLVEQLKDVDPDKVRMALDIIKATHQVEN